MNQRRGEEAKAAQDSSDSSFSFATHSASFLMGGEGREKTEPWLQAVLLEIAAQLFRSLLGGGGVLGRDLT